ncbi:Hsp70 family protein [Solwaraspora sp. WMMA2056]|uniref:Hsp70 family protein n=1 Tax=Solwaraspora sp. WMMA2056 TaxID=3015161 RepID=UPI00259B85EB|nr:Hsp70 family protein [Solwaraspora sp. WMMA2056]WJK38953.1 Hsp70 family protein [Solwaraspora sp. WMMA2056]
MNGPVRLAVDLGTTHTVATVRRGDEPPRTLLFDGSPLLASGVFVDAVGTIHTGRDAQRLAAGEPQRFEPHPKRHIDDGAVLLGDRELPVAQLLAASLRRVAGEAALAGVHPAGATVLTCPADWGTPRRDLLRAAADAAGLGPVRLLDEPIAAATYCVRVLGQQVPPGGALAVFDFGGGTLDVAVVRNEPAGAGRAGGLRVLATGGLDDLGGLDVDNALVAHLGQLVATRDQQLWARLDRPVTAADRRDRHAFWAEVRAAKEMLSRTSVAPVTVPGRDDPMHLTREELDRIAGPLVDRAVDETRRVLQLAGVAPTDLAGLLLVGGASRMPLVASRLHARLGVAASVPEQPELPVAYGALHHDPATSGPAPSTATPYAAPSTGAAPTSPGPYGQQPARAYPPTAGPAADGPAGPADLPAGRPRRRVGRWVAAVAAAVVLTLVGAVGLTNGRLLDRMLGRDDGTGDSSGTGLLGGFLGGDPAVGAGLTPTHEVTLPAATIASTVTVAGDLAVYASVRVGATTVTAVPAGGGDPVWNVDLDVEPTEVVLTAVGGLLVVDAADSATDAGDDIRVVLDAADGAVKWKRSWETFTDVVYVGTDVVVEIRDGIFDNAVARVDLTTGEQRWRREAPDDDLLIIDAERIRPVSVWTDGATVPDGAGLLPAAEHALADNRHAAADRVVELNEGSGRGVVLDVGNGRPVSDGDLPLDHDRWTVYDGLAIGKLSDDASPGRAVLAAYDLDGFTKKWEVPFAGADTIERVKACGPRLVCVAVEGTAYRTVAVRTTDGAEAWKRTTDSGVDANWYAGPDALVFGDQTFDTVDDFALLAFDGTEVVPAGDHGSAAATGAGRAAVVSIRVDLTTSTAVPQVAVWDTATGRRSAAVDVGADLETAGVQRVVLGGDTVAVVTADHQVRVLTVPADLG